MKNEVLFKVRRAALQNDRGKIIAGVVGECELCKHCEESFGQGDGSIRRLGVMMNKNCPRGMDNFYKHDEDDPSWEDDDDADAVNPASPYGQQPDGPAVRQITRPNTNPPDERELLVYRTYAAAAIEKKTRVEFSPQVVMSLLNMIDNMTIELNRNRPAVEKESR